MFSDGEILFIANALGFAAGVYNKKSRIAGQAYNKQEAEQFFKFSVEAQTIAQELKRSTRNFHPTKQEIVAASLRIVGGAYGDKAGGRLLDPRAQTIAKKALELADRIKPLPKPGPKPRH